MEGFKKILYVTQGLSEETEGLRQALSLSRNNNAALKILAVIPQFKSGVADYQEAFEAALLKEIDERIAAVAAALEMTPDALDLSIALKHERHMATAAIQTVMDEGHDLLVKEADDTGDQKGFRAADMDLLRKCPCPLWLARPIAKSRGAINVAVAVDPESEDDAGKALSRQMLEMGGSLAADCSGQLAVISCWDYEYEEFLRHNPWAPLNESDIQDAVYQSESGHSSALQGLLTEAGLEEGKSAVHHVRGKPETVIPEFVKNEDIDILIMGTVARTGVPGFIIGNTAENVVQSLSCSPLALKPEGFVSPVKPRKS